MEGMMSSYKRKDAKFNTKLGAIADRKALRNNERVLKAAWHGCIALVGAYELGTRRTLLGKILAVGLVAFHADACYYDWQNKPTTLQRLLRRIR
jgi:hypothetical protein